MDASLNFEGGIHFLLFLIIKVKLKLYFWECGRFIGLVLDNLPYICFCSFKAMKKTIGLEPLMISLINNRIRKGFEYGSVRFANEIRKDTNVFFL